MPQHDPQAGGDDLATARAEMARVFGFAQFRPGQEDILRAALAGENVLAVMPTGAGKSLCYQLPALLRPGLTIVVSPLIALMRDQVRQLREYGVAAGALNSATSSQDRSDLGDLLRQRRLRLVYVAPERLVREDTQALLREGGAHTLAIDEAHCVSQWGHDFRPEYRTLREMRANMGVAQTIAVTATADPPTRRDIVERLFDRPPRQFLRSFDRPNLRLAMATRGDGLRQIAAKIAAHKGESGIVYCASRKGVEEMAENLRRLGHWALPYHAGMEPSLRSANQDEFLQNDGVVMVATVAFGMGIDKPDVRFVCHANLPSSIEAYYQEIGRAGRDGLPADTLTLYNGSDILLRQRQIEQSEAPIERKRLDERKLEQLVALCETPRCRRQTLLAAFGETIERCGNCDICEGRHRFFDGTIAARKAMSAILRTRGRFFPPPSRQSADWQGDGGDGAARAPSAADLRRRARILGPGMGAHLPAIAGRRAHCAGRRGRRALGADAGGPTGAQGRRRGEPARGERDRQEKRPPRAGEF